MRYKLLDYLHSYRRWCRENDGEWTDKDEALYHLLQDYEQAVKNYEVRLNQFKKQKRKDNKTIGMLRYTLNMCKK